MLNREKVFKHFVQDCTFFKTLFCNNKFYKNIDDEIRDYLNKNLAQTQTSLKVTSAAKW